jgi:hypothetical protein
MVEAQGGVCAICKSPCTKRLAVDHCHTNGHVRGLLCWRCNTTLGKVEDNSELLRKMAAYLDEDFQRKEQRKTLAEEST